MQKGDDDDDDFDGVDVDDYSFFYCNYNPIHSY